MRFWDASAVLPLLVEEGQTAAATVLFDQDRDFVVWWATPVECASALSRLVRERRLEEAALEQALARMDALMEHANVVEPCESIRFEARRLLRNHPLRAADSLQLAAAVELRRASAMHQQFVTFDERLGLAARREGFVVNRGS